MRRGPEVVLVGLAFAGLAFFAWNSLSAPRADSTSGDEIPADSDGATAPATVPGTLAANGAWSAAGPTRGGRVTGVVRRRGRAVAARVDVWPLEAPRSWPPPRIDLSILRLAPSRTPAAGTAAGPDGRFEVAVSRVGSVLVRAKAADGSSGEATASLGAPGSRAEVAIDLLPTAALHGRAVYRDGRPFRGSVVVLPSERSGDGVAAEEATSTDEEGRFTIERPRARLDARFVVPGEVAYVLDGISVPTESEWLVVVDRVVSPLEGRVVDDVTDAPVADATIRVESGYLGQGCTAVAATDGDGRFSIAGRRDPWVRLEVAAAGHAPRQFENLLPSPLVVRLAREASVVGTVRRAADGQAVPDAAVFVCAVDGLVALPVLGQTSTGADGRYEIEGLPPGDVVVFASAPGLVMALPADAWHSGFADGGAKLTPGQRETVDLALVPSASVRGRVLDVDGHGVAGAVVDAVFSEGYWKAEERSPASGSPTATDSDGAFVLEGLPPDLRLAVRARTGDGGGGEVGTRTRAGKATEVEIRLVELRTVAVTVLDARDGTPVPDARVSKDGTKQASATDDDGRASIRVPVWEPDAGVHVEASGFARAGAPVKKEASSVEVRLRPALSVRGRVERDDGSPAGDARVFGAGADRWSGSVTAWDGTFTLVGFDDEVVNVSADASIEGMPFFGRAVTRPGTPATVRLEAGTRDEQVRREFRTPPTLHIRAEDEQGRRIPSAIVQLKEPHGGSVGRMSGGEFSISVARFSTNGSVEPLRVGVWEARDEFGRSLGLAPGFVDVPPDRDEVVVRLAKGVAVDGVVVGPQGDAVRGVLVSATQPRESQTCGDALARTRTGPDGRFVLDGLPAGADLRLSVRPPSGTALPLPLRVKSGDTGIRIVLKAAVAPWIRVVDPDGRPVANAYVDVDTLRDDGTAVAFDRREADAEGVVRSPDVDPARVYSLRVESGGRRDLAPLEVRAWKPHDDTLRLPRFTRLDGRVLDEDGRPVVDAFVSAPGGAGNATTDANGRFSFARVVEGRLLLRIEGRLFQGKDVAVEAGPRAPPIVIALYQSRDWRLRIDGWPRGKEATLSLFDEAGRGGEVASGSIARDGSVSVRTDPSRTYTAWYAGADDETYVLARGLRPSDGEARLTLGRGGAIRGRATLPAGARSSSAVLRVGPAELRVSLDAEGRFEFRGVPPGRLPLEVSTDVGSARWRTRTEASAGDRPTLTLSSPD